MKKETFEDKIKNAAEFLSNKTQEFNVNVIQGKNITLSRVYEIVIKIVIVLVALSILKLPFAILGQIFRVTLDNHFLPLTLWQAGLLIVFDIIYFIVAVMIIFYVFRNEFFLMKENSEKKIIKKKPDPKIQENQSEVIDLFSMLVKILVVITIVIPLVFCYASLVIATAVIIYLIYKGVFLYGLLALLIGLMMLISFVLKVIFKVMKNEKVGFSGLIISLILILAGGLATIDWAVGLKIREGNNDALTTKITRINIDEYENMDIYGRRTFTVNDNMPDGSLIIKKTYQPYYQALIKDREFSNLFKVSQDVIENLKHKIVYLPYFKTEIIANSKTLRLINYERNYTIIDETNICAEALQEFYQDRTHRYYYSCIKDDTTFVLIDNQKIKVSDALEQGLVTIDELKNSGLEYYSEPLN